MEAIPLTSGGDVKTRKKEESKGYLLPYPVQLCALPKCSVVTLKIMTRRAEVCSVLACRSRRRLRLVGVSIVFISSADRAAKGCDDDDDDDDEEDDVSIMTRYFR